MQHSPKDRTTYLPSMSSGRSTYSCTINSFDDSVNSFVKTTNRQHNTVHAQNRTQALNVKMWKIKCSELKLLRHRSGDAAWV